MISMILEISGVFFEDNLSVHSTTILVQGRCFMMFDDRLGGSAIYKRPVKYMGCRCLITLDY